MRFAGEKIAEMMNSRCLQTSLNKHSYRFKKKKKLKQLAIVTSNKLSDLLSAIILREKYFLVDNVLRFKSSHKEK